MGTAATVVANVLLLWRTWNLHGFVVLSQSLYIFLFAAAPFRNITTGWFLVVTTWSAYQLVGTAIDRSMALVESSMKESSGRAEFADLYTLWASFLVVHFGGPDTITALSMVDNNLWRRVYAHSSVLTIATVSALWRVQRQMGLMRLSIFISTMLILVAGIIKTMEKFLSLQKAGYVNFRKSLFPVKPNPVVDYAAIMKKYNSQKACGIPVKFVELAVSELEPTTGAVAASSMGRTELNEAEAVKKARHLFDKFKGMYVDMAYCCHDRRETRDVFLQLSPLSAFKVAEIEMKFSYEEFYTKLPLLSTVPYLSLRWISFFLEVVALILWSLEYKHDFRSLDVSVTRFLFFSTVIIDIVGFVKIYCSWHRIGRSAKSLFQSLLPFRSNEPNQNTVKPTFILSRRWSEAIPQFNFINYCTDDRYKSINNLLSFIGAKDTVDGWRFVLDLRLTNDLKEFIFQEVRCKSFDHVNIWKEACSSRGSWILDRYAAKVGLDTNAFLPWIKEVEYDQSLLIWHIATDLCYEADQQPDDTDTVERCHREYSKKLSDYMMYLLFRQPEIMSGIAPAAEVIFRDTCSEAREFFRHVMPNTDHYLHKDACQRIIEVPTDIPPSCLKDVSKSVLFDACQLAKYLIEIKTKVSLWKFTSQVWVELLCYAAVQTSGSVHVIQLCKGGELLTVLRILMLNLGLSNQFRKAQRIPRAQLVPDFN